MVDSNGRAEIRVGTSTLTPVGRSCWAKVNKRIPQKDADVKLFELTLKARSTSSVQYQRFLTESYREREPKLPENSGQCLTA